MASPISPNPISPPLLPGSDKLSPMGKLGERPVVIIFKKDSTNPPGSMQKTFDELQNAIKKPTEFEIPKNHGIQLSFLKEKVLTHIESKLSDDCSVKGKIIRFFYNLFVAPIAKFRVERKFKTMREIIAKSEKNVPITEVSITPNPLRTANQSSSLPVASEAGSSENIVDENLQSDDMPPVIPEDYREDVFPNEDEGLSPEEVIRESEEALPSSEDISAPISTEAALPILDQSDEEGFTQLTRAVHEGNEEKIKELIETGANVNAPDFNGWTPLTLAVSDEDNWLLTNLLTEKVNLDESDGHGWTPLTLAVRFKNENKVSDLIKAGANVNTPDGNGFTPLTLAVFDGDVFMFSALKTAGADLTAKDDNGFTPLTRAVFEGNEWMVSSLIKFGADLALLEEAKKRLEEENTEERQAIVDLLVHFLSPPTN